MKCSFFLRKSLTAKMVLAFILVAVPPMLLASQAATGLLSNAINSNVGHWLEGVYDYLSLEVEDSRREIEALYTLLKPRFVEARDSFTREEVEGMAAIDVDFIVLRNERGEVLFTNPPGLAFEDSPVYPGASFRWALLPGERRELAVVSRQEFAVADGNNRILELGSWFDMRFSEQGNKGDPIEIRLLLPRGDGFMVEYSSTGAVGTKPYVVPEEAAEALKRGAEKYFIPDPDWTDASPNSHLFKSIRNEQGEILAVLALTANMLSFDGWLPSTTELFWWFFILGTLFSGCAGFFLARKLGRPLRNLNRGVRSIAAGNLDYRIEVKGEDEVAELGRAFNFMTRQLEAMRRESIRSARQERSLMLGEVALGFAHEIRNPLVVIKTSAELVHNKLPAESKEARLTGFVVEEVGRIDSLISEFLTFAKPAPLKLDYFHLAPLLGEVIELSAAEAAKRGVAIAYAAEAENDLVLGEQNQIRQVILNLVLNALEAMPGGGQLEIRTFEDGERDQVCFAVGDSGAGIPERLLPSIFLPFFSTKKNGLGLGLAKAHAIVEEHGGSIRCRSEEHKGTVFTVCLGR